MNLDAREEALVAVARDAGDVAKRLFSNPPEVKLKGKQDYITAADGEIERLIVGRLKERFPGDAFLGEEGGAQGKGSAIWVIDPIDGTANFAHRMPHFYKRRHARPGGHCRAHVRRALPRARRARRVSQ